MVCEELQSFRSNAMREALSKSCLSQTIYQPVILNIYAFFYYHTDFTQMEQTNSTNPLSCANHDSEGLAQVCRSQWYSQNNL